MISESGLVRIARKGGSGASAPIPARRAEIWLEGTEDAWKWETLRVIGCRVCGAPAINEDRGDGHFWIAPHPRCERHLDRNPCAIEGCKRSRQVPESGERSDDNAICGTHWRAFVPPGSRVRRAYNAHWRRAKRKGWTLQRIKSFERLWDAMIRMARRRAGEGFIDEAEINRLMGWD